MKWDLCPLFLLADLLAGQYRHEMGFVEVMSGAGTANDLGARNLDRKGDHERQ
jgi:hypothetical protein